MPIIDLVNTKLNLRQLGMDSKSETYYPKDLQPYLSAKFPMFGTTGLGNSTNNTLYLPRATAGYLIRFTMYQIQ